MQTDEQFRVREFLCELLRVPDSQLVDLARTVLAEDAVFDVAHPVNRLEGLQHILEGFIVPLRKALAGAMRRDELFIAGANRRDYGGEWLASVAHYVGNFNSSLFGIGPSGRMAFLRSGEFIRVEEGHIVEAKIIMDFPDLMRQAGCNPFPEELGAEILFPGPATHDGILPGDPERGERTLDLVEGMLGNLREYDPVSFSSARQTGEDGFWHDEMFWYGPGGIGSNFRWEGFVKDHRKSFLEAFPDRAGGDHYCRIGDGDYAAVSGWPSMTMTHCGRYLGIPATGRQLTLRVMDFYRCRDSRIMENWVLLDLGDLVRQMGVDIFASG